MTASFLLPLRLPPSSYSHIPLQNGGTDDVVYGQDGAKDLAKSDPDQAITNADSHEYFAENNPAQD